MLSVSDEGKKGGLDWTCKMQKCRGYCTMLLTVFGLILTRGLLANASHIQVDGFCREGPSPPEVPLSSNENIYDKVTNPTLSPSHLLDLPGFTRSVYKKDYALITPESQVFSALPEWTKTAGAYLMTPAIGSHFVMYLAKMEENATSSVPPQDVERFIFVVKGEVVLSTGSEVIKLPVDSFAYAPPNFKHSIKSDVSSTIVVFERRYQKLGIEHPQFLMGATDKQALLETPGEVFSLRKLLPTQLAYDFNIHIMDFQPGEYLNVKEVHYNQHGLLLLQGHGIYRLGNDWHPVQAGDVIWMAPFVPQWYAALGKTPTRYLLYKDVNRNPMEYTA